MRRWRDIHTCFSDIFLFSVIDIEKFSFRQIQLLLEEHALVIRRGKKRSFKKTNLKLSQDVLEDIKGLLI